MSNDATSGVSDLMRERRAVWWTLGIVAFAIGAAYHNSFSGPFVFDDIDSITANPSIRQFGTAWQLLPGAGGTTVAGRPLVNVSLAVNYAVSGEAVWSYHLFNLLLHAAGAALLFGIVRSTLRRPVPGGRFGAWSTPLAGAVAVLWALHPLQTESVTYVIQRAESLMAFFYLLTLFAFVRSVDSVHRLLWQGLSLVACLAGMATKEVMASAPVIVLLYDRTFVSGTVKSALVSRWPYYGGLAASWILLLGLSLATGGRGGTAGFGVDITWWQYGLTQCWAVVHYLRLAFWPDPLVFDYGTSVIADPAAVWPQILLLAAALTATLWSLYRWPMWGFLGAFFFAVLAPSSSVVPVATQTIAEHRMYLPLAAVMVSFVMAAYALLGKRSLALWAIIAVAYGVLTSARNTDYRSHEAIWADTVAKRPENAFAQFNLAQSLQMQQRYLEAIPHYEAAIRLIPDYIEAHTNLGAALQLLGRWDEAEKQYQAALRYDSRPVETLVNLGSLLLAQRRWEEAGRVYVKLLEFEPERVDAHVNLAQVLFALGKTAEAQDEIDEALRLAPESADAHFMAGTALAQWNQAEAARRQFETVLSLRPGDAAARAALEKISR